MKKTPQEFRRENVKALFGKTLKSQAIELTPCDISVRESRHNDFTVVSMIIEERLGDDTTRKEITTEQAKGFVDGMFKACYKDYVKDHNSLKNIRLIDYQIKPKFNKSEEAMRTAAETTVSIMVGVKDHGIAEFSCTSRSILYSSFTATLKAFQFYINCDKTFRKIKLALDNAQIRNRGDLSQLYISELALLTGVNTYAK